MTQPTAAPESKIALVYQAPTGMIATDEVSGQEIAGPGKPQDVFRQLLGAGYTAAYETDIDTGETFGDNWLAGIA